MFIDEHREGFGVEAICKVLPIVPSTYYRWKSIEANPERICNRHQRDLILSDKIMDFWKKSGKRYGAVKLWHDLVADGIKVARCTVVRLMKSMGIQGITRGKLKTTKSNPALHAQKTR